MSYIRVIPRDLFNEGNLLKMLGALSIALDRAGKHTARFDVDDVPYFDVRQRPEDGSIVVANLPFSIAGTRYYLSRPLNSRSAWPLYARPVDGWDEIKVFEPDGTLSPEFLDLIASPN